MTESKKIQIKRTIFVIGALIGGFLMPYISRIPLAFKYGTPWIWKYMDDAAAVWRWNGLHAGSLIPIAIFGAIYIYTEFKWQFYGAAIAHFALTALVYYKFMETYGSDDFLGCILFPPFFALASIVGGALGFVVQIIFDRRKNSQKLLTKTL